MIRQLNAVKEQTRGDSQCKGPEVGPGPGSSENGKKEYVEEQCKLGKSVKAEIGEVLAPGYVIVWT